MTNTKFEPRVVTLYRVAEKTIDGVSTPVLVQAEAKETEKQYRVISRDCLRFAYGRIIDKANYVPDVYKTPEEAIERYVQRAEATLKAAEKALFEAEQELAKAKELCARHTAYVELLDGDEQ